MGFNIGVSRFAMCFLVASMAVVPALACVASSGDDEDLIAIDEDDPNNRQGDSLSSCVTVGSRLRTSANLNLRAGPGTTYSVITVIPAGAYVYAVRSCPSGRWYNIKYGTKTGWGHGDWLNYISAPLDGGSEGG